MWTPTQQGHGFHVSTHTLDENGVLHPTGTYRPGDTVVVTLVTDHRSAHAAEATVGMHTEQTYQTSEPLVFQETVTSTDDGAECTKRADVTIPQGTAGAIRLGISYSVGEHTFGAVSQPLTQG